MQARDLYVSHLAAPNDRCAFRSYRAILVRRARQLPLLMSATVE